MPTTAQTLRTGTLPARGAGAGLALHPFLGIRRTRHSFARDRTPAFYVLEQRRGAELLQRGVIGALDLGTAERAVHPHEHVLPHKVAVQRSILRAVGGSPEPVLLACLGATGADSVLDRVVRRARRTRSCPSRTASVTSCGGAPTRTSRRWWPPASPSSPPCWPTATTASRRRWNTAGPSAACRALVPVAALVVDTAADPLGLRAIHRHLPGLPAEEAAARASTVATVEEVTLPWASPVPRPGEFILTRAGVRHWSVRDVSADHVRSALRGRPPS